MSGKYNQKLHAKQSEKNAIKTTSNRGIQRPVEATWELIDIKTTNKITGLFKTIATE